MKSIVYPSPLLLRLISTGGASPSSCGGKFLAPAPLRSLFHLPYPSFPLQIFTACHSLFLALLLHLDPGEGELSILFIQWIVSLHSYLQPFIYVYISLLFCLVTRFCSDPSQPDCLFSAIDWNCASLPLRNDKFFGWDQILKWVHLIVTDDGFR